MPFIVCKFSASVRTRFPLHRFFQVADCRRAHGRVPAKAPIRFRACFSPARQSFGEDAPAIREECRSLCRRFGCSAARFRFGLLPSAVRFRNALHVWRRSRLNSKNVFQCRRRNRNGCLCRLRGKMNVQVQAEKLELIRQTLKNRLGNFAECAACKFQRAVSRRCYFCGENQIVQQRAETADAFPQAGNSLAVSGGCCIFGT